MDDIRAEAGTGRKVYDEGTIMGLHFSRLAVAVSLALSCSVLPALAAADQPLDEFYIEIKGPDKPASPLLTPKAQDANTPPARSQPPKAPATRRSTETLRAGVVQPFAEASDSAATVSAGRYGPVKSTETLWSIAEKVRPGKQVSVYQTLLALYRKNPGAFANGRISNIYRGSMLSLPTLSQVQAESEALAQELVRKGALNLAARPAAKPAAPRVLKLTPPTDTKPVVKLTPAKPGVETASVASAAETTAVAPAAPASTAEPAKPAAEQVGSQLTLNGQPEKKPEVDASVTALVGSASAATVTATASAATHTVTDHPAGEQPTASALTVAASGATAPADAASSQAYQQQIAQLSDDNRMLKSQLKEVNRQLDDIRAMLAHQASAAQASAASEAEKPAAAGEAAKPSWLHDLIAAPINLALLLMLPVLLVLAVVSLWLRSRNRRNQASEQEEAETAALLADGDSHFDHLMAADMVAMNNLPDLEQQDETVQPQPEFMVTDELQHEPALDLSAMPAASREPGLLPEMDDPSLDLHEAELDLSVAHDVTQRERKPVDEADFLSELGVGDLNSLPLDEPMTGAVGAETATADRETFEPRVSANLSNDELDALFQSIDDLADSEPVHLDDTPAAARAEDAPLLMAHEPVVAAPIMANDEDAGFAVPTFELPAEEPPLATSVLAVKSEQPVQPKADDEMVFALFDQADVEEDTVALSGASSDERHTAPAAVSTSDLLTEALPAEQSASAGLAEVSEAGHLQASLQAAAKARAEEAPLPAADWYPQDETPETRVVEPSSTTAASTDKAGASKSEFRDIDELLAEAEQESTLEEPYAGLSLDVGLNDFPEVLPDARGVDVDAEGELAAKLDLARAYLEIDDKASAAELLQEVIDLGDNQQKAEAQKLLRRLR